MRYRFVFDRTADPVFETDARTSRVTSANSAACRLFGCAQRDLVAASIEFAAVFPDATGWWKDVVHGASAPSVRTRAYPLAGPAVDVVLHGTRLPHPAVDTVLLIAPAAPAATDEHLFLSTLAHDLHSPLRAIRGFMQLLADGHGAQLDDDGRRFADSILSSTERMQRMVEGLSRYGDLATLEPSWRQVDMQALGTDVVKRLQADAANCDITIDTLPAAWGDPDGLRQVWTELVQNATKFSGRRAAAAIRIGYDTTARAWYVRDNGVGFDMAHADRLFGLFQRLHSADDFPGTGVGLALAARILAKHGGRIWAESRPGNGTTVFFDVGQDAGPDSGRGGDR